MSAFGPKRTCACALQMFAFEGKADMLSTSHCAPSGVTRRATLNPDLGIGSVGRQHGYGREPMCDVRVFYKRARPILTIAFLPCAQKHNNTANCLHRGRPRGTLGSGKTRPLLKSQLWAFAPYVF